MINEFIGWLQEPGKWNDAAFLCGLLAVSIFGYLVKRDGIKNVWKNF